MRERSRISTPRRPVLLRLALGVIVALATITASPALAATGLPPQGLYEECAPSNAQQCLSELKAMSGAGFKLVMNYQAWNGSLAQVEQYAQEAQSLGIQIIWPLTDPSWRSQRHLLTTYPQLAASCGCKTNAQLFTFVIEHVATLPATWGYYVGDEIPNPQASSVIALAGNVRAIDSSHQLLVVGDGDPSISDPAFLPAADVIGVDVYPVGSGEPLSVVGDVGTTLQGIASPAGKGSAMVLQAFSWTQYPGQLQNPVNPHWPTEAEMQQMRDYAISANPSIILWYNYADIQRSDNPAQHWSDLVTAAFAPYTDPNQPPPPLAATTPPAADPQPVRRHHRHHRRHHRRHRHRHHAKNLISGLGILG